MSVLPIAMNSRDGPYFNVDSSSPQTVSNSREDPARDGWDEFEDLRGADTDHYGRRYSRSNRYVADDERSQFTADKGKKESGHSIIRHETPKPVVNQNKWSIITNKQRIATDERIPADDGRSECREISHNWSNDSENIFGNDKSFEEPEPEPAPEVPLPFSYLQLQSQANDMFVHLDVTECCVESKVDALITKNASYDSQVSEEVELEVEREKDLTDEVEDEPTIETETTGDEIISLVPVENDVMKCERQVGGLYKKSMKVGFVPGQSLIVSRPNFLSAKEHRIKKKAKNSINLTEEAPMVQIFEHKNGEQYLEPMFFEPNFKELVQYKPFYDQESIDNMIVNDMLDIFQETTPMIVISEPKIPELECILELSEDEDFIEVNDISVTQISVASSLGSSVGSSSSEGLSDIPENEEYDRQMDKAIDDLLFRDAAEHIMHAADKVDATVKVAGKGMQYTRRYFKNSVKSMKKSTKTFFKALWKIQIIKPKPSLGNVSGAAAFTKKFREVNPKKRDLPLFVTQNDGYSDCSMTVASNSYTQATPQSSRRFRNCKYNRRGLSSHASLSDTSTISTKLSPSRSRGRFGCPRTFRNTYVQDEYSRSSGTSFESSVSYTQSSLQSGCDESSNISESDDSWSTIYE